MGPLSRAVTKRYFQTISTQPSPLIGDRFHFYHADLGPTNILLADDGPIKAVLDWESPGLYPKFWNSLKPYRSGGFNLDTPDDSRYECVDLLELKLSELGFTLDHGHVDWQKTLYLTFFSVSELHDAAP